MKSQRCCKYLGGEYKYEYEYCSSEYEYMGFKSKLGMFPVNRLTEKYSVNRFSINRTETEKMAANLVFCKSTLIRL